MDAKQIRELSSEELEKKLQDTIESLFNLRFQHQTGQLENPRRLRQVKRDIARLRTVKREFELNIR
ncbi:MAG TPA: 50S ribosomal protein L29 [Desulfosalsimonadaceae bacterium]|nr:50S ribosomal protein L29 [Desulfosalsimonadaceae bacterium]